MFTHSNESESEIADMRTLLKYILWSACALALLSGCAKKLWSSGQGFPEREIVFQFPSGIPENTPLGFIRSDGTGLITRTVAPGLYTIMPTWSPDGEHIAFRTNSLSTGSYLSPNRPRVISHEGHPLGMCQEWEDSHGRIWVTAEGKLLLSLELAEERRGCIVLADFHSCEVLAELFEASSTVDVELLDSATLSIQGWLAVSRIIKQELPAKAEILVIDPVSHEIQVVGNGLAPAWSQDGEWLAYTALDGIYIVRRDGTRSRKLVELDSRRENDAGLGWSDSLPTPSWSPDGKWLVYHRLTSTGPFIYKVSVESGIEIEIFEGGMYPDWRWDMLSTGE